MDLISVIVPLYNVEKYLIRCVDSIRNQTYTNLEIILVDDGSPDRCPQMCDELAQQDSRIRVIHKQNGGQGYARNSGLEAATGAYVTFIDSDDWIGHDHIVNLYEAIVANQADIAIGAHISVNADGTEHPRFSELPQRLYNREEIIHQVLLPLIGPDVKYPNDVQVNSSSSMSLYSMEIIREYGIRYMSERYSVAEDLYFNLDFLHRARRLVVTDENGYYYFENTASHTRKYDPKRFERTLNFYSVLSECVKKYGLTDQAHNRIERSFLMKIRISIRLIVLSDMRMSRKYREIREILNNEVVQSVLRAYPVKTYVPAIRLLSQLMRIRSTVGVYALMWFREAAKQNRLMKNLMKKFGIGK